jgi:hypothetical protein
MSSAYPSALLKGGIPNSAGPGMNSLPVIEARLVVVVAVSGEQFTCVPLAMMADRIDRPRAVF